MSEVTAKVEAWKTASKEFEAARKKFRDTESELIEELEAETGKSDLSVDIEGDKCKKSPTGTCIYSGNDDKCAYCGKKDPSFEDDNTEEDKNEDEE